MSEDLKVTMGALGFEEDEILKMAADTGNDRDDSIGHDEFLDWMMGLVVNRDPNKTFRLSDHPQASRIPAKHYKRAAKGLGELMAEAGHDLWAEGRPPDLRRAGERI